MNRYFDFNIPQEAVQEVLNCKRELECIEAIIEYAEMDNVRDTAEKRYPDTPLGMNLTIRLPSRLSGMCSLTDQTQIEEILAAYQVSAPSSQELRFSNAIRGLMGKKVIAHVGLLRDGVLEGEYMTLYGISPFIETSR